MLEVEKEYHPFILGPNGSHAKALSEQTHARINIPPHSMMKNEITVAGDKECVAQAVSQIRKIYMDMVCGCGLWAWGRSLVLSTQRMCASQLMSASSETQLLLGVH